MKEYRIECTKAGCTEDATRVLHWKEYRRKPWMMCDKHAEMALAVVHI